jgi:hypothetical protein
VSFPHEREGGKRYRGGINNNQGRKYQYSALPFLLHLDYEFLGLMLTPT